MSEALYHDEDTMTKVYQAFRDNSISDVRAQDVVNTMMNRGIVFRETTSVSKNETFVLGVERGSFKLRDPHVVKEPSTKVYRVIPPRIRAFHVTYENINMLREFFPPEMGVEAVLVEHGRYPNLAKIIVRFKAEKDRDNLVFKYDDMVVNDHGDILIMDRVEFEDMYEEER